VAAEYLAMEYEVNEPEHRKTKTETLRGPYSPLEMKMFGKVQSLLGSVVKIEDDSVNSVILEDQPGDNHERVLVAAYVRMINLNNFVSFYFTLLLNSS